MRGERILALAMREIDRLFSPREKQFVVEVKLDCVGSAANLQIDLSPQCQNPVGLATNVAGSRAYVNCWVTQRLAVVDLTTEAIVAAVQSTELPTMGTPADAVRKGRRFYFTGRGRWSSGGQGWSGCGSCHPDGLTDNITWSFAAGPRQTTSMDGTYSKGADAKQRILNWTGIFDEMHDFENNTRGVSGGLGAITVAKPDGGVCGTGAAGEERFPLDGGALPSGLAKPIKELQNETPVCVKDWDELDEFVKTNCAAIARQATH